MYYTAHQCNVTKCNVMKCNTVLCSVQFLNVLHCNGIFHKVMQHNVLDWTELFCTILCSTFDMKSIAKSSFFQLRRRNCQKILLGWMVVKNSVAVNSFARPGWMALWVFQENNGFKVWQALLKLKGFRFSNRSFVPTFVFQSAFFIQQTPSGVLIQYGIKRS